VLVASGLREDGTDGTYDGDCDDEDEDEHHVPGRGILGGDAESDDWDGKSDVGAEEVTGQYLGP
jgi:hypothetical protein